MPPPSSPFPPSRHHCRRALLGTASLAVLGMMLAAPMPARAADFEWSGAVSTDWFANGNWVQGAPPGISDSATIAAAANPASIEGSGANAYDVYIGGGNTLTIPTSLSTSFGYIGFTSPGAVTVTGSYSGWYNSFHLTVGDSSNGALTVENGGGVYDTNGVIGNNSGSTGTVTVNGSGSIWNNAGNLYVGFGGNGTLTVENGGDVYATFGYIGNNSGSTGAVTINGAGSTWTNANILSVGNSGNGTLTVENGGKVDSFFGYIGNNSGSTGAVTVNGAGSTWTNTYELSVGSFGNGTLNIQNGGAVSSAFGSIGDNAGSTGAVTVNGAGSTWTNTGNLTIGRFGNGTLAVANGGAVSNASGSIGDNAGSTGAVTVDGAGSTWTNTGNLTIGRSGNGTLAVENGGAVSNAGDLYVGFNGNGTLAVANGGAVSNTQGDIGSNAGSTGTVTVDGAGSTWTNTGNLTIGNFGNGTLTIQNGGRVDSLVVDFIGKNPGSTGTVTVDGATSRWINSSGLSVGVSGNGTLTIQNGGRVDGFSGYIGNLSGSTGAVTVNGAGSTWTNTADLFVGLNGNGTLTVTNGGAVYDTNGYIGNNSGSTGTVTVNGSGSTWGNAGNLTIGNSGNGTLTVTNGGAVSNASGYIGVNTGSTGAVTVNGAGSTWTNAGNLYVGLNGNGTLAVANGGAVSVAGNLTFGAGSTYAVGLSAASAEPIQVTGTATLAGTVKASLTPGASAIKQYTILHADDGLGGTTFGSLTNASIPAGFSSALSYGANDVFLNLTARLDIDGSRGNIAALINNHFNNGGALPAGFLPLFGLSGAQLSTALSQLSGEATTGAQAAGVKLGGQFLSMLLDPSAHGSGGLGGGNGGALGYAGEQTLPPDIALAYAKVMKVVPMPAAAAPRWNLWGSAFGGTSTTGGNAAAGTHDLTARTGGFAAGADHKVAPDTVAGFALAGGFTNWGLGGGLGGGRGDAFQAGVYAMTQPGPWYFSGALSFAQHWITTERTVFAGNHLQGRFEAQSYGGRIEGGWRLATALGAITPYAAAQVQRFHAPGFAETDLTGGGVGLAYASRNTDTTRSELGARFERLVAVSDTALLALQARAAWAHDWTSGAALTPVFQALPGASFVVAGATAASDLALVAAGAELRFAGGWSIAGRFNGEFADGLRTYAGTGTLRYAW